MARAPPRPFELLSSRGPRQPTPQAQSREGDCSQEECIHPRAPRLYILTVPPVLVSNQRSLPPRMGATATAQPDLSSEVTAGVNPWLIAAAVMLATFMEVLDTAIASVALPYIAGSLSATTDEATWVLTSYLVANAIILPASNWFSLRFGRKRFLMTCVAIFTAASFACEI